jgi:hypothetical protein
MADQSMGNESGQMIRCLLLACAVATCAATTGPIASYTGTSANVSGAPDNIRIDILRWSTEAERNKLMDAWDLKAGSGRGGRGAGRGGGGRGGRGGAENPTPPPAPEAMLARALQEVTTVGYLWSREVAGYAVRYAGKTVSADGSERVVLITQRRLGAVNDLWKPVGSDAPAYDFSVIELRTNAKGNGEGKTSLNGKVAPDAALKIVALDNYDALPVVFEHLQRRTGGEQ